MADDNPSEPMNVGNLMALLQSVDPPNDATIHVEIWSETDHEIVELPLVAVTASIGYGRPSKLVFITEEDANP